jgi:serine/threonine protein kinase
LKKLSHERVIKLVDVVKERKKIYLILENGGKHSLCGVLRKEKILSEDKCKSLFKQVLEGIAYCHETGVCHRDLKPENILVDERGCVKIIDFGFSAHSSMILSTYCGTPAYMAPEIIKKQGYVGAKADIWALGVMLYLMAVGTLPFRAPHEQELNRLISAGKYRYRDEGSVPVGARKLIARMLTVSADSRPSAKECLEDAWLH